MYSPISLQSQTTINVKVIEGEISIATEEGEFNDLKICCICKLILATSSVRKIKEEAEEMNNSELAKVSLAKQLLNRSCGNCNGIYSHQDTDELRT